MNFTSIPFLVFFLPPALLAHYAFRSKAGANTVLLLFSLLFYGLYDAKYLLFLCFSILITYAAALYSHKLRSQGKARHSNAVLYSALFANILVLLVCKYTNFALENINQLTKVLGITLNAPEILLPVGLSFYVFQSSSYLMDVQSGKLEPERNFIHYALFVSFFPTITSGPIQRGPDLLPQIDRKRTLSWDTFRHAFLLFLWGAFLKMVIADNLATFTNLIFDGFYYCGFTLLFPAMCAYSVQIYADFSGYSCMATAIAMLFGFTLKPNFLRPYAATTISDFWRRWHISLSGWFRDYIYIPLGGNRKGTVRKFLNLTIVFLVSGLWHGASWSFILWGGIHAFYQVFGAVTKPWRQAVVKRLGMNTECFSYRLYQRIVVFLLVSVAWVFFRCDPMIIARLYLTRMVTQIGLTGLFDGTMAASGMNGTMVLAIATLLVVSILQEKGVTIRHFLQQNLPFRLLCYAALIIAIVLFGAYGPAFSASNFIYAGF